MNTEATLLTTIVCAAAFGLIAQVIAQRWRIPVIVLLLLFGVCLGPDVMGLVRPAALGESFSVIISLTVAIILFDGALNLRPSDLRQAARDVRNLVTIGVAVTLGGAALAAFCLAGLDWPRAVLFGALVSVTGPTVVQPLLRHVEVRRQVRAILEGEAILVDPIGAILAVAAMDLVLYVSGPHPSSLLSVLWGYMGRMVVGLVVGVAGGLGLSFLLRRQRIIRSDLVNIIALAGVWAVFAVSDDLQSHSGILAVVAMGLAFQRGSVPDEQQLRRFKGQLTTLGIGLLFILAAANVRIGILEKEGWGAVLVVLALMFVIRPAAVFLSLAKSSRTWEEKTFIAWIGPRGVVAASMASVFAFTIKEANLAGGQRILALTFLTIAMTVTVQGLTAPLLARLLRVQSMEGHKAIIIGAGALGREVARILREGGRPIMLVDQDPAHISRALVAELECIMGNPLDEQVLESVSASEAESLIAITSSPEANVLAVSLGRDAFGIRRAYPALDDSEKGPGSHLVGRAGGGVAFGRPINILQWEHAVEQGAARQIAWKLPKRCPAMDLARRRLPDHVLPVACLHGKSMEIAHSNQVWHAGDEVVFLSLVPPEQARAELDAAAAAPAEKPRAARR